MTRALLSCFIGPYRMVSLQPAGKQQIHINTCACVCQWHPWPEALKSNMVYQCHGVGLLLHAAVTHKYTHTHRCRPIAVVYAEFYGVGQLFFFHTDWPSGPETHIRTNTQIHNTHIHTHVCSHLIWAV